ncbi:MAG: helix-turn-helix domain-containing protein, partial [bacterium]
MLANQLLEARHVVMRDGRAGDRVDARTIRFYQTLGIVPKPAYEGRRAIYERDHLVRVVSAKALQAEGYSLAQIQGALPMRKTDELTQALLELEGDRREGGAEVRAMPHVSFDAPRAVAAAAPSPSQVLPSQVLPSQVLPSQVLPSHVSPLQ